MNDVRTFRAATMRDALRRVRDELGGDAVIVSSRSLPTRGLPFVKAKAEVEVVAGVGDSSRKSHAKPHAAPVNRIRPAAFAGMNPSERRAAEIVRELTAGRRPSLFESAPETTDSPLLDRLRDLDFAEPAARHYAGRFADDFDDAGLLAALADDLPCRGGIAEDPDARCIAAFVGPTGVGKTTTLAKLAARLSLRQGRSVGLVTADTYRIGAVEQLATYARILRVPLEVAGSPGELPAALGRLDGCDAILIDTAGRAPRDDEHLSELAALLSHETADGTPIEAHLVLPVSAGPRALARAAGRYGRLGPVSTVLTKLDEAEGIGAAVELLRTAPPAPVSLVGTGQDVPDDLAAADPAALAAAALGEWRSSSHHLEPAGAMS